jgi:ABC-type polar amino acid transport system ATPase subunit
MSKVVLEYRDVSLRYGDFVAIDGVSETICEGDCVVVCGASGSGKSSLLRCTNGLEPLHSGDILFEGASVRNCDNLPRLRTRIGMVFQQFELYPHMSCLRNVTLAPMKVLGWSSTEAEVRARALLERFGVLDQARKHPAELSGGQQQRVAICRALILEPRVMMFDEPTSALDPEITGDVLLIMKELAAEGMTLLVVTHEMRFARDVADRVLFMEAGRIIERGSGVEFFRNPSNPRTRRFLSRIAG